MQQNKSEQDEWDNGQNMEWNIEKCVAAYEKDAIAIRRFLHAHAELSFEEYETTAFIKEKLEEYGIDPIPFKDTGLYAIIEGQEPRSGMTMIRADIDALPVPEKTGLPFASLHEGVSHSCGHDIHTAILLLTARILKEHTDCWKGSVCLVFQPAEENAQGARYVLEQMEKLHNEMNDPEVGETEMNDPEVGKAEIKGVGNERIKGISFGKDIPCRVIGYHTRPSLDAGRVGFIEGTSECSYDLVKIRIHGKGGHGAYPHTCVDPVMISAFLLIQLKTALANAYAIDESCVLTFGKIQAGELANVIPENLYLEGTLRTQADELREQAILTIERVCQGCGLSFGADIEATFSNQIPAIINDKNMVMEMKRSAEDILGTENVVMMEHVSPGSDDFAWYLKKMPGLMFKFGTGNEDPNSRLALHNGSLIFDEKSIAVCAKVLLEYLNSKNHG